MLGPEERAKLVQRLQTALVADGEISKELVGVYGLLSAEEIKTAQMAAEAEKLRLQNAGKLDQQKAKIEGELAKLELKSSIKRNDAGIAQQQRLFDLRAKSAEQRIDNQPVRRAFRDAAKYVDPIKIRNGQADPFVVKETMAVLDDLAVKDPGAAVQLAQVKAAQSAGLDELLFQVFQLIAQICQFFLGIFQAVG
jgi:hypothetical protein